MPAAAIVQQTDHVVTFPNRADLSWYTISIVLDGQPYLFEFYWNARANSGASAVNTFGSWYFNLFDGNNDPLVMGIRVVVGFPLLFRYKVAGLPPGSLEAQDTSGANIDPGLNDLGSRVLLSYFPSDFQGNA